MRLDGDAGHGPVQLRPGLHQDVWHMQDAAPVPRHGRHDDGLRELLGCIHGERGGHHGNVIGTRRQPETTDDVILNLCNASANIEHFLKKPMKHLDKLK